MTGYDLTIKMRKARRKHPLTATEQALFYELVAICNEAEWEDVFNCSNEELCHALNISENTLNQSRVALINAHLIHYQSGKSKRQYSRYSFSKKLTTSKSDTNMGVNPGTNGGANPGTNQGGNGAPTTSNSEDLYKQYNTRETETKPNDDVAAFAAPDENAESIAAEERKKIAAQKKKDQEAVLHWAKMVSVWFEFYRGKFNDFAPTFEGKDQASLKKILEKLKSKAAVHPKSANQNWTEDYASRIFSHFLIKAYADRWRSENFLLHNLNKQFDAIIQTDEHSNSRNGHPATGANVDSGSAFAKIAALTGGA